MATFKKIMAKDNPVIMYGDSTGLGKAIAPELNSRYKVLYGSTSFSSGWRTRKTTRTPSSPGRPTPTSSASCWSTSRRTPREGKPKVAFFYSDTEFGKDPIPYARKRAKEAWDRRGLRDRDEGRRR